ncbi:MAG: amidohydrolase family protein [Vicingaceae bacterium]
MKKLHYITFLIPLYFMSACYYTEEADLLIHNATIYTVNTEFTIAEAMAIKDGKIIDIGPNNELKNRYEAIREIDAKLKPIYPGFIDAHCHFFWYGNTFFEVDLVGTKSWEDVLERTKSFADENSDGWVTGRGWDQNDWDVKEFPAKSKLDSLFPDRAVLLKRIDGHAAIANQKALDLSEITINSSIDGGVVEQKDGKLTGILIDNAIDLVSKAIPAITEKRQIAALKKAEKMCFAAGLTTVDDAMMENDMANLIDSLHRSGELKMKVYGMLMPTEENKKQFLENGPYITPSLSIRSFKYFADGALGSRGAKLIEPYHDDPTNDGLFLKDSAYLANEAKLLNQMGFQMNTHCIGDDANRLMLNIYANTLQGTNDKRWRIEHAQIVASDDMDKFGENTIIPSVQPTHATSDMYWLEERLGKERMKTAYAYKELLEQSQIIALGTDFPIESIDPIKTFYAATIRKDNSDFPKKGFQMQNALSREEALKGMTIWAAMSNFEEKQKGSIEVGKAADFIILDKDLLKVEESELLKIKVQSTFLNGEEVYSAN